MSTTKIITKCLRLLTTSRHIIDASRSYSVWSPDNIVKSPFSNIDIPNRLLADHIWENMDKWADKTAVLCGVTKRSLTFHQLYKQSRNFAVMLRSKLNIREGDVVCIMMPNSPDYVSAILGALQAGTEVTTINPIYTAHEVSRQLTLSKAKIVIGIPETIAVLKEAMQLNKLELPIIACKGYIDNSIPVNAISFDELVNSDVDESELRKVRRNPSDIALLPYSSGTTGLPKGVELTNMNIVANLVQQDVKEMMLYEDTTASHQDVSLGVLPFYHIYGLVIALFHKLSVGVKAVTLPKFQPEAFLTTMKEQKISILCAVPPIVLFLGSHPDVKMEHLETLKVFASGAAPLPKLDVERVLEKVKHNVDFVQLYGLTETGPLATSTKKGTKNYNTCGFALANTELKIVDPELRSLGPNEFGELLIRGPQVIKRYRDNPEASKNAITEDGWLKSGDLASIDKEGAVTIADRLKELIKVKGYQVPPAELESVIREHPDVEDAAVVGIPDAKSGEVPKAFVVLKNGHKLNEKDIINFVADRVAEYKRITKVVALDNLPRNPSGKLLRRVLRDKYI